MNPPYYLLRGGWLSSSYLSDTDVGGYYWLSEPLGSDFARVLYLSSGYVNTGYDEYRHYGFSVRCVAAQ